MAVALFVALPAVAAALVVVLVERWTCAEPWADGRLSVGLCVAALAGTFALAFAALVGAFALGARRAGVDDPLRRAGRVAVPAGLVVVAAISAGLSESIRIPMTRRSLRSMGLRHVDWRQGAANALPPGGELTSACASGTAERVRRDSRADSTLSRPRGPAVAVVARRSHARSSPALLVSGMLDRAMGNVSRRSRQGADRDDDDVSATATSSRASRRSGRLVGPPVRMIAERLSAIPITTSLRS